MGKRRNSQPWVDPHHAHELDPNIHFVHQQFEDMADQNGVATNSSSEKSEYLAPGLSAQPTTKNSLTAKLFQASTYFPIAQRSASTHTAVSPSATKTAVEPSSVAAQPLPETKEPKRIEGSLWQKSLEHIAVGFYVFGFVFAPILLTAAAVSVLLFPPLWIFVLPYLCWLMYDWRTPKLGSRPWARFRSLTLWTYMANYFPMRLHKTAELPADKNYLIGCHPHGILSFGTFLTFCTEAVGFADLFPGLKRRYAVTLSCQYWFPLRREFLQFSNTISSEMDSIDHVLSESDRGTAVGIVAGGAAEALDSTPDSYKLTLKNRKGFIKLALKHGSSLVPMYTFGETSTYRQVPNPEGSRLRKFQNSLKHTVGITMPFFYGCGFLNRFFGWMPYRTPLNSVVGKPINVKKVESPTCQQIDELHAQYLKELSSLFDAHKHKYGIAPNVKLEYC